MMKRGDLVTVVLQGDYGKPRPALIVQADAFAALPSVTILRLSSEIVAAHLARVTVEPTKTNGLRTKSQIMIDKAASLPRDKVGQVIGQLDARTMHTVSKTLMTFLGLEEAAA